MKLWFLIALFVLLILFACGPATAPTDIHAIQTQAAASVFATQTASAPTMAPTASSQAIPPRRKYDNPYNVKETYDKIKDETTVILAYESAEASVGVGGLFVAYTYTGTKPQKPALVYWAFVSRSQEWKFLSCYDLALLLDNSTRLRPKATHDGQVKSGYVIEEVQTELSLEDFLKIVNAKRVDGSVCNTQFTLAPGQMEGLKDVASRMQP